MKTVSVIIPVYYNESSLLLLYEELLKVEHTLCSMDLNMELVFVDDGSGDDSYKKLLVIKEKRPETKVIKLTRNFGAVHASWTGFSFVTGDSFTILAADLQDPPEMIVQMAEKWLEGCKFVVCARLGREDPIMSRLLDSGEKCLSHKKKRSYFDHVKACKNDRGLRSDWTPVTRTTAGK